MCRRIGASQFVSQLDRPVSLGVGLHTAAKAAGSHADEFKQTLNRVQADEVEASAALTRETARLEADLEIARGRTHGARMALHECTEAQRLADDLEKWFRPSVAR